MFKRSAWLEAVLLVFIVAALLPSSPLGEATPVRAQETGQPPPLPPARKIPGINAEDPFPRGCVDCHINYRDVRGDKRLSAIMQPWGEKVEPRIVERSQAAAPKGLTLKGKHPLVDTAFQDIPAGCVRCHSQTSKTAPHFSRLMHSLHLVGGDDNHFMALFQGDCTPCHKLGNAGGFWVPSGPEN